MEQFSLVRTSLFQKTFSLTFCSYISFGSATIIAKVMLAIAFAASAGSVVAQTFVFGTSAGVQPPMLAPLRSSGSTARRSKCS